MQVRNQTVFTLSTTDDKVARSALAQILRLLASAAQTLQTEATWKRHLVVLADRYEVTLTTQELLNVATMAQDWLDNEEDDLSPETCAVLTVIAKAV